MNILHTNLLLLLLPRLLQSICIIIMYFLNRVRRFILLRFFIQRCQKDLSSCHGERSRVLAAIATSASGISRTWLGTPGHMAHYGDNVWSRGTNPQRNFKLQQKGHRYTPAWCRHWFSDVTGCTRVAYIQWRQKTNFSAPSCIQKRWLHVSTLQTATWMWMWSTNGGRAHTS